VNVSSFQALSVTPSLSRPTSVKTLPPAGSDLSKAGPDLSSTAVVVAPGSFALEAAREALAAGRPLFDMKISVTFM
jgi:hypothetical protein